MKITIDTDDLHAIGENIAAIVQDDQLILVVDTKQEIGLSSSGKMMGIASTEGFTKMPGNLKGNVWIGKKVE